MRPSNTESGQAIAEFALFAAVLSLVLAGILYFGHFGINSFYADVRARNRAFSSAGVSNVSRYQAYIRRSAALTRFQLRYENRLTGGFHAVVTTRGNASARADATLQGRLANIRYSTGVYVDRDLTGARLQDMAGVQQLVTQDLFGK